MKTKVIKSEKKSVLNSEELNKIARQLRCPTGNEGIAMGALLKETNNKMIEESINALQLKERNRILELGHGSCNHLESLLKRAEDLKYFGMEISEVMKEEAEKINEASINNRQALFQIYNGCNIPYVCSFFDKILTVNTIYFIESPVKFLNEMYRVLKPNGVFVLTFADRGFMKQLPFVVNNDVFKLYDKLNIKQLISQTDFDLLKIKEETERVKSKSGEWVDRNYLIVTLSKVFINSQLN